MPVRITPSSHGAKAVVAQYADDPAEILRRACPYVRKQSFQILQSSFDDDALSSGVIPSDNGLVYSLIEAYSSHHHLSLRPEDIWFAILTQISIYINKHAEELRDMFVSHQGQKLLEIEYNRGDRFSVDFGVFATAMGNMLADDIKNPELREWILPSFTTTTANDTIVASILMMGAMQKYFKYRCCITCGIPSVTLLGERADWQQIFNRLDTLTTFGEEPAQFCRLLQPVVLRFIRSFDAPSDPSVISFWQRVLDVNEQMSGVTRYSGWITAFCFWNEDGKCLYDLYDANLPATGEDDAFGDVIEERGRFRVRTHKDLHLELDGVRYHKVDSKSIPPGWSKVPVVVDDNGQVFETEMIAGSVGITCSSSGLETENGTVALDSMQPEAGWWIFETGPGDRTT